MRYQLVADNAAEEDALKTHPTARVLFDPFLPVIQARAIIAGVRLGIFGKIGYGKCTPDQLAHWLSLSTDALTLLLPVLVCAGYLAEERERYALTDLARATLLSDSSMRLTAWVEHNLLHWKALANLEDVVKTGKGIDLYQHMTDARELAISHQAMLETARPAADWVASQVPVRDGADTMLDIGGSHGLYGAKICRLHPPMKSVVLDLPDAIGHAIPLARQEGIDDIVSHRAGNILTEDVGREIIDLAFLGNVIHHFSEEQNRDIFRRTKTALRSNGTIAIWDFKRPDPGSPRDLAGDGMALLFQITSTARCYTMEESVSWIKHAGFVDIITHPTPGPSQMLITARVP
jgi:hypothetical protein